METTRRGFLGFLAAAAGAAFVAPAITKEVIVETIAPEVVSTQASTLFVKGFQGKLTPGDIFSIESVFQISPHTGKVAVAPNGQKFLKQFVVTRAVESDGSATTIDIFPAMIAAGPYQNVEKLPPEGAKLKQFRIGDNIECDFTFTDNRFDKLYGESG
jgi:hypothetical protein